MNGRFVRQCGRAFLALSVALSAAAAGERAIAQQTVTIVQDGKPVQMSVEQAKAMGRRGGQPQPPGGQPGPQPGQEPKPEDKDKKKEGEDGKKKEGEGTIKRPEKPPVPPDPKVFKNAKLDDKGRVPPFNFMGQPWPDVMQWLASLSKCTLDYQELPSDYLNLTTDRPYALDEVRDRINRVLQARGFTSIRADDVLSVFKIEKIDPSLVHRVEEEKLYDLKPYDYVKVSFELPANMEVDKAKDDVKQVLNPTAKVFPLVTSKRLLIMDTVANLRTVSELLNTERAFQSGKIVPKEIVLKYARPQQVIEILYMMVGVDPKGKPAQTDPQAQQQQMQMMQQMQQQGRGAEAAKMMQKDAPKVYLAYNRQKNSVLINAPPDLMKIIEQTIQCLDVPFGDAGTTTQVGATPDNQRQLLRYPLQNLDPDKFVSTLEEIGGLSPYASFKVDDNNKALFAYAPEADQKKIKELLRNFDAAGRKFKVIPLRHRMADAVAATINKMMAGQNDKKDDKPRRSYFWDYDFNNRDDKKKDTMQGFGCDADIENNQLLVWATDNEMERVQEFLMELGELPGSQRDTRPVRIIESSDAKTTPQLLKQLQEAWSASGKNNQLIIRVPPETKTAPKPEVKDEKDKAKTDTPAKPANDRSASTIPRNRVAAHFVELGATAADAAKPEPTNQAAKAAEPAAGAPATVTSQSQTSAPVTVTVTPDGRLMISSTDIAALDRMEQMIEDISPPQRRFKVFRLNYIKAIDFYFDVLKDYFKEDLESKGETEFQGFFYGPRFGKSEDKTGPALSKRRKLILTWDPQSNSILAANGSASQMAELEQLVVEFDKPAPSDNVEKRTTKAVKIRYSKPTVIAAAVKEVYRDLLSSKDKEFDRGEQKEKKGASERVTIIDYAPSMGDSGDGRPSQLKVGFEGALSLGADDVSGTLIVSAQSVIFNDIVSMVHELDEQAAPKTTVQVYQTHGIVRADALQKALDKAVGKAWLGSRPEQQPNQTGAEGEANAGNEKGRRNEQRQQGRREN